MACRIDGRKNNDETMKMPCIIKEAMAVLPERSLRAGDMLILFVTAHLPFDRLRERRLARRWERVD